MTDKSLSLDVDALSNGAIIIGGNDITDYVKKITIEIERGQSPKVALDIEVIKDLKVKLTE